MKRRILAVTLFMLTLAAAGCSQQTSQPAASAQETTAEPASSAEDTTAADSSETAGEEKNAGETTEETAEEAEQDSASGSVTSIANNIMAIATADGSEMRFDIASADINQVYDLSEGDKVYIEYNVEENASKPLTATYVEVEEAALAAIQDPVFTGTVDAADENTITLTNKRGDTCTFRRAHAFVVAQDGVQVGKEARVTYIGEPDDDSLATKIVMEDSYDSPDADANIFIGTVIGADPDRIVVSNDDEDYFTFLYDMDDPQEFPDGSLVQIYYDGVLSGKEIPASDIVKYEK